jgi:hypothetical protein
MNSKKIISLSLILALLSSALFAANGDSSKQVHISGASLFVNFFKTKAATNDYIDVDLDGKSIYGGSGSPLDWQLAEDWSSSQWSAGIWNPYWLVQYRGVGSGNGLKELVNFYNSAPSYPDGGGNYIIPSEAGTLNRTVFYDAASGTLVSPPANISNPGGSPIIPARVDIAVMDVPTTWFVTSGSSSSALWSAAPKSAGYGLNKVRSWDPCEQSNTLKSLGALNTNVSSPDRNTVFDVQLAWVPIAVVANQGTGMQNLKMSDARHLFLTGRTTGGENLIAATRDSGSGTRNGSMNCFGIDPSWGRGDNVGPKQDNVAVTGVLGPQFQPANLGGSSRMEDVIQMSRLSVGYTGLADASRAADDASSGKYEIVNIMNDLDGGNVYVRPTITNILQNSDPNTGWRIGGSETFATVGNPMLGGWSSKVAKGSGAYDANMYNINAAYYISNIKASLDSFITTGGDPNTGSPAEYLAYNYFVVAGVASLPDTTDPSHFVSNPDFVQAVQNFTLSHNNLVVPAFGSKALAGKCPARKSGVTYSDGSVNGSYTDSHSNNVTAGKKLAERNQVTGDFNYDGAEKHKRNINDVNMMMLAFSAPRSFESTHSSWGGNAAEQAGDYVIVEVIGDFTSDGNFDANDIRYFADGLAMDSITGKLNRYAGFVAVDTCWTSARAAVLGGTSHPAGNFFKTTIATGKTYQIGDSRGDIARLNGNSTVNTRPGANPIGADGKIDANDIDYLRFVLHKGLEAEAFGMPFDMSCNLLDWQNPDDAVFMDLSCDMNGDLLISEADVHILIYQILGTELGDVNLDGVVNQTDFNIITANLETQGGWAKGDMNGDGEITNLDLDMAQNPDANYDADINHDGSVNMLDLAVLGSQWLR